MAIEKGAFEKNLRAPRNENESLYPPLGRLSLESIAQASMPEIDELLSLRHGFSGETLLKTKPRDNVREALKRVALARLEGIPLNELVARAVEVGSGYNTYGALTVALSTHLNPAVTAQIRENGDRRIRFAAMASDPDLRARLAFISRRTGLEPESMFRNLPPYKSEGRQSKKILISAQFLLHALEERLRMMDDWGKIGHRVSKELYPSDSTRRVEAAVLVDALQEYLSPAMWRWVQ